MKKSLLLLPIAFVSITAYSQPYIVAGYGISAMSHDETVIFTGSNGVANTTLKPDSSDSVWSVAAGYRANNNIGLEVGYQQFEADTSIERFVRMTPELARVENNWKADIKAKRLSIKPVYFFDINEKFSTKFGLGLTYTNYKITGTSYEETDHLVGDFETFLPIANVTNPAERSENAIGMTASIGAEYNVWKGITVGVEGNVSYDKMATSSQLFGTVGYRF